MNVFSNIKDQIVDMLNPSNVVSLKTYINRNTNKKNPILNTSLKAAMDLELSKAFNKAGSNKLSVKCYEVPGYYFIICKVPSLTKDGIYYDEVFRVSSDKKEKISDREIKIFSNDPSFIYRYAYVFNQLDLLIPEYKNLLPPECLNTPPTKTNPLESPTAHKYSMMAGIYLLDKISIDKIKLEDFVIKTTLQNVFSMTQSFNSVMNKYQNTKTSKPFKLKNL